MPLFQLIHKPICQGSLFLILTVLIACIARPQSADRLWVISGLLYGCFIVTNAVVAFFVMDTWPYFFISLGVSFLYLLVIAVTVKMFMHVFHLEGSEESAMVFMIVIFHPLALLLAIFLKWIF
jgi:hypothetical protein